MIERDTSTKYNMYIPGNDILHDMHMTDMHNMHLNSVKKNNVVSIVIDDEEKIDASLI